MEFYPAGAPVPDEKRTDRIHLRPLRATDVELDYEAVMSSTKMLRRWSQSGWPSDDFTLAENLEDLEHHERDHLARRNFTFTVMAPTGARCLGCVYITPLARPVQGAEFAEGARYAANVRFWVRESALGEDLDKHVLGTLREWFGTEWAFDCLLFTAREGDDRQVRVFKEAGLELQHTIGASEGQLRWLAFG